MQALVLVGGEGTRLRPLTLTRPKPALQLVDRPFLRHMLDWLGRHGVTDVVLACGYGAAAIREALGDGGGGAPAVRYLEEPEPLGTAGPIRLAADHGLLGDRFLALNGDVLADLDLGALVRAHEEHEAVATLALHPVEDVTGYGLVRRNESGAVTEFVEKPDPAAIDTDEINAGAYFLERAMVDLIPAGRQVSIEREVFPRLVGQGLYGLRLEGYWMDIGTPDRYLQASWDILERRVETAAHVDGSGVLIEDRASVDPGATVGPRAVVATGSVIGQGAVIEESVVLTGCSLGPEASVRGSILAPGVEVGEGASVGSGAVVGEGARVEAGATVPPDARVQPGERVA